MAVAPTASALGQAADLLQSRRQRTADNATDVGPLLNDYAELVAAYRELVTHLAARIAADEDVTRTHATAMLSKLVSLQTANAQHGVALAGLARLITDMLGFPDSADVGGSSGARSPAGLAQHTIDAARERPDAPVSAPSTPSPGVRGGTLPHPWERSGVYTPDPKFEAFIDDRFKDDSDRDVLIDAARVVFYPECQPTVTADHVGIEKMKTLFATVREYEESLDRQ